MVDTRTGPEGNGDDGRQRYTYGDRVLSLWQSAAHQTAKRLAAKVKQKTEDAEASIEKSLAAPVHAVHTAISGALDRGEAVIGTIDKYETVAGECASLAAQFLHAEIAHNAAEADRLKGILQKAKCDVGGWAGCVREYWKYKMQFGKNPYRAHEDIVRTIPDKVCIAIVGDWGTGENIAREVLEAVATQQPDILIHLGDIYYSGTKQEVSENFLQICRSVLGRDFPIYTLCGNHDMYSGGNGYYALLTKTGQRASYCCLRNKKWQILTMDTGNHDNVPMTHASNMTRLNESEIAWHVEKFRSADGRKTILMSHHQLFSPFEAVGRFGRRKKYAYNPNLLAVFQKFFPEVKWWFWGHEHTLAVYDSYMGLERGRCVGSSAIPVLLAEQSYTQDSSLETLSGKLPTWQTAAQLGNDGEIYNHAFALLELNGAKASVEYFEVKGGSTTAKSIFSE